MGKDRLFPSYGELNPIEEPLIGRTLDVKNTTPVHILKESAVNVFKKDSFENTGPLKGIVLRVDNNNTNYDPNSWISRVFKDEKPPILKTLKVRIPEIHAHIPEPSSYGNNAGESNKIIDMYPSFLSINEEISNKPVAPGDVVLVDFGNRTNLTQPMYLGPVFANPRPGAVGEKSTKESFKEKPSNELAVEPPKGDSLNSNKKEAVNQIPEAKPIAQSEDINNQQKPTTINDFVPETNHVAETSSDGLPKMKSREMAYRNGTPIGEIDLIEINAPLSSKPGVFIAKSQLTNFMNLINAAKQSGILLTLNSGFRSFAQQEYLYNGFKSGQPGFNLAAKPGFSNHQTGIAFDFANTDNGRSATYKWLAANAHKYGFANAGRFFKGQRESWHWEFHGLESKLVLSESQISVQEKQNSFV